MKTSVKLVLIYLLMQILGMLTAMPLAMVYLYIATGTLDVEAMNQLTLAPSLLLGIAYMGFYLHRAGYLRNDGFIYSFLSPAYLGWSLLAGASMVALIDGLMSVLSFLPDWMEQTFDVMQSGWVGIVSIALIGPILEELLFRGAVTKLLLRQYKPAKAIVLSALVFGLFHMNPVQVVGAFCSGLLFAWLYYKSRSVVPCILIHVLNNSLSVWLTTQYADVDHMYQLIGLAPYLAAIAVAAACLALAVWKLKRYETLNVDMQTVGF